MATSHRQHAELTRQNEIADEIARVKTDSLEVDLALEVERLNQKQERLTGQKLQTEIEKQRTIAIGYGLDKAKIEADSAALGVQAAYQNLGMATDDLLALEARRRLNQQTLMSRHRLLELQSHELQSEIDQKTDTAQQILGLLPTFDGLTLNTGIE